MANLQYLNEVKIILNAFEDSEITAHQFLHGLLSTNIFEDHPITHIGILPEPWVPEVLAFRDNML